MEIDQTGAIGFPSHPSQAKLDMAREFDQGLGYFSLV